MRKIILLQHLTLDGFAGGSAGELDWMLHDEEQFEFVHSITQRCDAGIYGRKTYDLMEAYWPSAADQPGATKHDRVHSKWYNSVQAYVVSDSMKKERMPNRHFICGDLQSQFSEIKNSSGKDLLLLGSPSVCKILTSFNLIDEFFFFITPVILGKGIAQFGESDLTIKLKKMDSINFPCGVSCLHFLLDK